LVVALREGQRRIVTAVSEAAREAGLVPGMTLAHAQALQPGLAVAEADPAADGQGLARLARACARIYSPIVAADAPDGLLLDISGCAHLFGGGAANDLTGRSAPGGEAALLTHLLGFFAREKIAARAAIADTVGAAHALARFGAREAAIAPAGRCAIKEELATSQHTSWPGLAGPPKLRSAAGSGSPACAGDDDEEGSSGPIRSQNTLDAIAALPVAALRLAPATIDSLMRLGLATIGALAATPRAPLARRFGPELMHRLDQAVGRAAEPIEPVAVREIVRTHLDFAEPIATPEDLKRTIEELSHRLCAILKEKMLGARRLDLLFHRVDGAIASIMIATVRAAREEKHLSRLLTDRLPQINPGLGIEKAVLQAPITEPLAARQIASSLGGESERPDLAPLIDRLRSRLGVSQVYRLAPVESDVPERSLARVAPLEAPLGLTWPETLPRPTRIFIPPQPIEALALLPDHPPVAFTWRRVKRRVRRADGPERIYGEWWRTEAETHAVRDYFQIEDEMGARYWLFRTGDGQDPKTGAHAWFLHGLFG
jgi:protein ImuB